MSSAQRWILFVGLGTFAAGCAHGAAPGTARTPAGKIAEDPDPTSRLIASADAYLASGVGQSKAGHLNRAREDFDRALDVYLNAPGGAMTSPLLAKAYRQTLETIQLHEFEALAAGDGFTETLPEPASIDEVADLPVGGIPASEETRKTAEAALRGEHNDLAITLNDSVLAAIDLYQGPLREWFEAALARGGRYLPRIRQVFAAEGIPQDLAYVALVESAFKTGALSRAKARGVWQFIPTTGKRFGLKQDWWVDERSNPEKSTRAAAVYLKQLYGIFRDWNLALAAYNAGEGKVSRGLNRLGQVDFWRMAQSPYLARETKNYVPMIHAAIVVAKAQDRYGFSVTPEPLLIFDAVPVDGAMDLRLIAECASTPLQEIQALNPELRRLATPAGRTFSVKVPTGSGATTGECLANIPPDKRVAFRTHTVSKGQTLSALAKRYGSTPRAIAEANGLSAGKALARGAELIIPIDPTMSRPAASATRTAEAAPASTAPATDRAVRISYKVKAGDTLTAIATRYRTTVARLKAWNRLPDSRLAVGDTLTLYTRRAD
jgi:membrane-bound lytic murein transglycosylase D